MLFDATLPFVAHLAEPSPLKSARGLLFVCFLVKMLQSQAIMAIYFARGPLLGHVLSNFAPRHATRMESALMVSVSAPLATQEKLVTR